MPGAYTPSAPYGTGTDDYRCFLLDPELDKDAWLTGTQVLPGNPDVVHHVILFQVPPRAGRRRRGQGRGRGRTRAGPASAAPGSTAFQNVDRSSWIGAWAPGRQGVGHQARLRHTPAQGQPDRDAGPLQPARRAAARHLRRPAAPRARQARLRGAAAPCCCPRPWSCRAGRSTPTESCATATRRSPTSRSASARRATPPTSSTSCAAASRAPGEVQSCVRTLVRADHHPRRGRPHAPAGPLAEDRGQPGHPAGEDHPRHPRLGLRRPGQPPDRPDPARAVRAGQGDLSPRPVAARQAARPSRASPTATSCGARARPTRCASGCCRSPAPDGPT